MEKLKGAIAVFLGASSFGILSTFVKKAYAQNFTLAEVIGMQVLFGMVILWAIYFGVRIFNKARLDKYPKKTKIWTILISGFSTGLVSILYYKCVSLVPASLAIVLLMQYIWIGALIEFILFRSKPSRKQAIGIVVILLSTLLATGLLDKGIASFDLVGIGYGLLAATGYASFLIVNGRVGNDYPPIQKSGLMVTGSCILIFILFRPFSLFTGELGDGIWYFGLILSVFGTVLPPLLFAYGIPKIGVSLSSILSAAELPVAVCMSYFVLTEHVTLLQWIGVVIILLIVVWMNLNKEKAAETA
ncbi:EamA family transporter [Sphingobacterium spiritivorum]|uniref:EamA family transporter n=1 Tax=Sphingobacterium spiritivorum TaxID=258 RepID=UPI003DA5BB9C